MFEKEILTKKQMVKIIMPKLRDVIAVTFAILLVILFFGLMSNWIHKNIATAMFEYEAVIFTIFSKIYKWIAIFCGICLVEFLLENFWTVINLYRSKYYLVVAPLKAKSKKEKRHGRRHYTEYSFNFDKLGTFKTPDGYVFYPFSKYDKMEPEMADKITELGEEFFLLVRGGKRKKIVHIFHKRLFDIQEYEYTKMFDKYYI